MNFWQFKHYFAAEFVLFLFFSSYSIAGLKDFYPTSGVLPNSKGTEFVSIKREWNEKEKVYSYHVQLSSFISKKTRTFRNLPISLHQKFLFGPKEDRIFFLENDKASAKIHELNLSTGKDTVLQKFANLALVDFAIQGDLFALIISRSTSGSLAQVTDPSRPPKLELILWNRQNSKVNEVRSDLFDGNPNASVESIAWIPGELQKLVVQLRRNHMYEEAFEAKIYEIDPELQKTLPISEGRHNISQPIVSHDGRWIAYTVSERLPSDPKDVFGLSIIELYERKTKARRRLSATFDGNPDLKSFTSDNQSVLYTEAYQGKLAVHQVLLQTSDSALNPIKTWAPAEKSSEFFVQTAPQGNWIGLVTESAKCAPKPLLIKDDFTTALDFSSQNSGAKNSTCSGDIEDIDFAWKARDGMTIHGIVNRPANLNSGPLLVVPHGGPTFVSFYQYLGTLYHHGVPIDIEALVKAGYTVFRPNVRGSIGYGPDYRVANWGDLGGQDWKDIEDGIIELEKKGWALRQKHAIAGWSYGGFLCAYGATKTDLFRAAACGAAITNWISHDETSEFAFYTPSYFGHLPQEIPSLYPLLSERSPALSLSKSGPPLLIIHGTEDRAVDFGQARALYRWAQRRSIPVKLLAYQGQGHMFTRFDFAREAAQEVTDWITHSR